MPKTKVSKKTKRTTRRPGKEGANKAKAVPPDPSSELFDPESAQQAYLKRKRSQLAEIKNTDVEVLRGMFFNMVLGRIFEEKCAELYRLGKIGGFCHLYIGQEAIAVGAQMVLEDRDYVITAYRDHVQAMVQGIPPKEVMAELYGRSGGNVGGKGGSMHMFSREHNFFGGHGIVGGQIGVGTGLAFEQKYNKTGGVTLCFFGDAAVNQGIFHESLNMAALWQLPCIYICENNRYGMGTSQARAMSVTSIAGKADSYGIANERVDGMDVMAVRRATLAAIERARNESLPSLLEIRSYRYMGHSMSDPGKYRTVDEVKRFRERDPVLLFEESLKEAGSFSDEEFEQIRVEAAAVVADAVEFSENSPLPDESELLNDVLV